MIFDDFKCDNGCKDDKGNPIIETHTKPTALAEHDIHLCPLCGEPMRKLMGSPLVDVAKGDCGNASTGYGKEICYKPSKLGRFKGTKIKKG